MIGTVTPRPSTITVSTVSPTRLTIPCTSWDVSSRTCQMRLLTSQLVQGMVSRVGDTVETVIVDGRGVTVPIMHVRADFVSLLDNFHMQGDMWFVDDTVNAWVTRIEMKRQDDRTFHMALGTI